MTVVVDDVGLSRLERVLRWLDEPSVCLVDIERVILPASGAPSSDGDDAATLQGQQQQEQQQQQQRDETTRSYAVVGEAPLLICNLLRQVLAAPALASVRNELKEWKQRLPEGLEVFNAASGLKRTVLNDSFVGRPTVLLLWDCAHVDAVTHVLQSLQQTQADTGFAPCFVSCFMGPSLDAYGRTVTESHLHFPSGAALVWAGPDPTALTRTLSARALPHVALLDPAGTVVFSGPLALLDVVRTLPMFAQDAHTARFALDPATLDVPAAAAAAPASTDRTDRSVMQAALQAARSLQHLLPRGTAAVVERRRCAPGSVADTVCLVGEADVRHAPALRAACTALRRALPATVRLRDALRWNDPPVQLRAPARCLRCSTRFYDDDTRLCCAYCAATALAKTAAPDVLSEGPDSPPLLPPPALQPVEAPAYCEPCARSRALDEHARSAHWHCSAVLLLRPESALQPLLVSQDRLRAFLSRARGDAAMAEGGARPLCCAACQQAVSTAGGAGAGVYVCAQCPRYVLCGGCYGSGDALPHEASHAFMRVSRPDSR